MLHTGHHADFDDLDDDTQANIPAVTGRRSDNQAFVEESPLGPWTVQV